MWVKHQNNHISIKIYMAGTKVKHQWKIQDTCYHEKNTQNIRFALYQYIYLYICMYMYVCMYMYMYCFCYHGKSTGCQSKETQAPRSLCVSHRYYTHISKYMQVCRRYALASFFMTKRFVLGHIISKQKRKLVFELMHTT